MMMIPKCSMQVEKPVLGFSFLFSSKGILFTCYKFGIRLSGFRFNFLLHLCFQLNEIGYFYIPKEGFAARREWSLNKFLLGGVKKTFVSKEEPKEIVMIADGKQQSVFYRYGHYITKRKRSLCSSKMVGTELVSDILTNAENNRICPYGRIDPIKIPELILHYRHMVVRETPCKRTPFDD